MSTRRHFEGSEMSSKVRDFQQQKITTIVGEYVDNGTRGFLIQKIYILDFMLLLNYQFNSKQVYILSGTLGNLIFFFRNHFGHFIGWLVPGTCFLKIAFFSKISVLLFNKHVFYTVP